MSSTDTASESTASPPRRADARRNHAKLIATARDAFAEGGTSTSLEEIARRAQVGIGTLYRNFPNRQALLEAVYVEEVGGLCRSAADLAGRSPWDALVGWLHRFVAYLATKQALAQELLTYVDSDAKLFQSCRAQLYAAGEPLVARAQEARAVRPDTNFTEVLQLVGGIAKIPSTEPAQIEHMLSIALDGLRYQPPTA